MTKSMSATLSRAKRAPEFAASSALMPAPVHPQSVLDLPPGEARESLLAVHDDTW